MKPLSQLSTLLACTLAALPVLAADPTASADWALSDDGAYVLDHRAGLAWPRCVEGMQWTGKTCTGKPLLLDRAEATTLAADRWKAEGVGWRLPRAAELQRLVDKSLSPPGLHPILFPAALGEWHWSATSNVSAPNVNPYTYGNIAQGRAGDGARQAAMINGWAVNLSTGEARGDAARASKLPVRLVRPKPVGGAGQ
ncbi:hypothetical protein ASE39_10425 [Acidovorax sp. Root267]|uniref:Lcl C-terminal domain-containing protein n=1 Tax=Acidovorax sp. Root267 TaxID=1736505 RepID=UPI00070BE9DE|nr:DUF1566 domain-containing protein [Acidovorax sp. Root267]KRD18630.1 hypothetical protein ASE39_10425 [Acidovorax sp. Root267]